MYKELEFENWSELKRFIETLNSNWMFRGQEDYSWKLKSGIDRVDFSTMKIANPKFRFERFCITDFRRNQHLYSDKYDTNSDFQTLSLIQHYGMPTRLLDFSTSAYVAVYFAVNKSSTDSSIYAINYYQMLSSTMHTFRLKYNDGSAEIEKLKNGGSLSLDEQFTEITLNQKQRKFVDFVQPFFLFDRLIQQSGVFLCQGDINCEFEENLAINYETLQGIVDKEPYYKIKINFDWRNEILRDLSRMNITSASLFPGIEGHLNSLKNKFEMYMEDRGSTLI